MSDEDRLLPQSETLQDFKGHSGCIVSLRRKGERYTVRKTSASTAYNVRLKSQIKKQRELGNLIRVPQIVNEGLMNGLVFFDMEYILGFDFASFALTHSLASVSNSIKHLFRSIFALATVKSGPLEEHLFLSKLASVTRTLKAHQLFSDFHRPIIDSMNVLSEANWCGVPKTACHGDFTLENMIFEPNGTPIFIDLLDGELESVWMDIAKLMQDLDSGWSLRPYLWNNTPDHQERLLTIVSRFVFEELSILVRNEYPGLNLRLSQFRLLQALRTLPYIRDQSTFTRVIGSLVALNSQF